MLFSGKFFAVPACAKERSIDAGEIDNLSSCGAKVMDDLGEVNASRNGLVSWLLMCCTIAVNSLLDNDNFPPWS